jgi:transcriptional regulator with XRE-family HTH domain
MTAHAAGDTHDLPAPRPPAEAAGDLGASGRPDAGQQPAVASERAAPPPVLEPPAADAGAAAAGPVLNPLQRLIGQRLRERGWSYGEVARRGGLPRSTVYTLATTRNLSRPPRPATIDALAVGLEVPVSAVRAAAAASTGLHYYDDVPAAGPGPASDQGGPGDQERELLIASIDELTAEDRRHVAALVASLRNRPSPGPADR